MSPFYQLRSTIGPTHNMNLTDVLEMKKVLNQLGLYEIPPHGLTQYPDEAFIEAIRKFQSGNGLRPDGVMRPDGPTYRTMEYRFDENHSDPKTLLQTGPTDNNAARLLQNATSENKGSYIWRTQSDGKVRSSHAERDGKIFSWDNPPEGGHPGEDYNCRCWADETDVDCEELLRQVENQQHAVDAAFKQWETIQKELEEVMQEQKEWQEKCDNGFIHRGSKTIGGAIDGYKTGKWPGAVIGGGIGAITSRDDTEEACTKARELMKEFHELDKREDNAMKRLEQQRSLLKKLWEEAANSGCES